MTDKDWIRQWRARDRQHVDYARACREVLEALTEDKITQEQFDRCMQELEPGETHGPEKPEKLTPSPLFDRPEGSSGA